MEKDYFVEILLGTYCTITPMRIIVAQALNNCLIALYMISDTPTETTLESGRCSRIVGRTALASKEFLLWILKFYQVGFF